MNQILTASLGRKSLLARRQSLALLLVLFVASVAGGCGKSGTQGSQHELFLISGNVTLDGKPLTDATVNFIPTGQTPGRGGFAVTDAEGNFTAQNYTQEAGLEAGDYNISFSKVTMPDGSPVPQGQSAADVGAINTLPARLTGESGSFPARLNVTTAKDDVKFELRSR